MRVDVPICDKFALTFDEAAAYCNVGVNQLRALCQDPRFKPVMLRVGAKVLLKRQLLEQYLVQVERLK